MSYREIICPDCAVTMQVGFMIDQAHGGQLTQSIWHPGPVEQKTILGLNVGIRTNRKEIITVVSYRCPRCGLLRNYAKELNG